MQQQGDGFSRIIVSALRGGSGKTLISIGIIAALRKKYTIAPFKKGPDYIDTGWLALAAGRPCYNLDTFLIQEEHVLQSFLSHFKNGDVAIIEGNRGLYDGLDTEGSTSTAALAILLHSPILLCVDCTKATRTIAAMVLGCLQFDSRVQIKGIILNWIATHRHETLIRKSIESHCGIPVIGAVPKLREQLFPERHMGLVPTTEHSWAKNSIHKAAELAEQYLDLDRIVDMACKADTLSMPGIREDQSTRPVSMSNDFFLNGKERHMPFENKKPIKIGIFKDAAFSFYYPENIEALISAGAQPEFISPFDSGSIPEVDALYIGGGFPETHAKTLAENTTFREQLRSLAQSGLPIYAECGGLMFLGEALVLEGVSYPMVGVFPVVFGISKQPQGHGYTVALVEKENPYFDVGTELRGHEFHYSHILKWKGSNKDLVFRMKRGTGFMEKKDGLCFKNVLATFTHLHALGTPSWAKAMVRNAIYSPLYHKKRGQHF